LVESADRQLVTFRYDAAWLALPEAIPISLMLPLSAAVETLLLLSRSDIL
jgi:HipA-like protein